MIRIHAQQVLEITFETIPQIETRVGRVLLDEHRVAVTGLRETIQLMFGPSGRAGLEHEANLGAD